MAEPPWAEPATAVGSVVFPGVETRPRLVQNKFNTRLACACAVSLSKKRHKWSDKTRKDCAVDGRTSETRARCVQQPRSWLRYKCSTLRSHGADQRQPLSHGLLVILVRTPLTCESARAIEHTDPRQVPSHANKTKKAQGVEANLVQQIVVGDVPATTSCRGQTGSEPIWCERVAPMGARQRFGATSTREATDGHVIAINQMGTNAVGALDAAEKATGNPTLH
jgi:hypothetical protein